MSKEGRQSNSRGGEPCEQGMEAGLKIMGGGLGWGRKAYRIGALSPVHCARPSRPCFLQEYVLISDIRVAFPT